MEQLLLLLRRAPGGMFAKMNRHNTALLDGHVNNDELRCGKGLPARVDTVVIGVQVVNTIVSGLVHDRRWSAEMKTECAAGKP